MPDDLPSKFNTFIATEAPVIHPRILTLGAPGAGKTYLIGLFHEMYKKYCGTKGVFHGDFDEGYPTLTTNGFDVTVSLYLDKNPKDPRAWREYCKDTEEFNKNSYGYSMVSGDSFTTMQNALINDIVYKNPIEKRRSYRNVPLTTQNDFGIFERAITNDFFPQFMQMCATVAIILTCHTQEHREEGEPTRIVPYIKGKALSGSVIGVWFNEVIYCKSKGTGDRAERRIQTSRDLQIDLKSQTKGMPFELSFEEYVFRIGVAYGSLKGDAIQRYARDKGIKIDKLENFSIPKLGSTDLKADDKVKSADEIKKIVEESTKLDTEGVKA